jgi:hypothetical protein
MAQIITIPDRGILSRFKATKSKLFSHDTTEILIYEMQRRDSEDFWYKFVRSIDSITDLEKYLGDHLSNQSNDIIM